MANPAKPPRKKRKEMIRNKRLQQVRKQHLDERYAKARAVAKRIHDECSPLLGSDLSHLYADRQLSHRVIQLLHDEVHALADMRDVAIDAGDMGAVGKCAIAAQSSIEIFALIVNHHGFTEADLVCDRGHGGQS